jgi:hypothetical protein
MIILSCDRGNVNMHDERAWKTKTKNENHLADELVTPMHSTFSAAGLAAECPAAASVTNAALQTMNELGVLVESLTPVRGLVVLTGMHGAPD